MDEKTVPSPHRPREVDSFFHRSPRGMSRASQHVNTTRGLIEFVTRVVQDRPKPLTDEVSDIADRFQITMNDGMAASYRLNSHLTDLQHVARGNRVSIKSRNLVAGPFSSTHHRT